MKEEQNVSYKNRRAWHSIGEQMDFGVWGTVERDEVERQRFLVELEVGASLGAEASGTSDSYWCKGSL